MIEVDEVTGRKWRLSSQQQKEKIAQKINILLAKELVTNSKGEFKQFLNEIGTTMQERALTENTLREILKDDE